MIENPEIKIRILREIKGYTQENMAIELKISTKAYQKIESGETRLSIPKLNAIGKVLQVDPLEILAFSEQDFFEKLKSDSGNNLDNSISKMNTNFQYDYIKSLKEEIQFLRKIISKNLDLE